jgi:membrane protease YdiL (CAAX protease family)
VARYFLFAFGLAWACQLPVYALGMEGPLAYLLLALGGIAPSLAGIIASRGEAWRALGRGPRPAWALALGLAGATALVGAAGLASGTLALGAPFVGAIILPPLGEELGWRGFLQPQLSRRVGVLGASVIVGGVWALWHLPTAMGHFAGFPAFAVATVADSVLIGWLWRRSGGSVAACVAAHAGLNLGIVRASPRATLVVLVGAALVAAVALGRRRRQ